MSLRAMVQQGVKDATGATPATSDYPEFKTLGAMRGAQQAHCPGLQESRFWPLEGSAW